MSALNSQPARKCQFSDRKLPPPPNAPYLDLVIKQAVCMFMIYCNSSLVFPNGLSLVGNLIISDK